MSVLPLRVISLLQQIRSLSGQSGHGWVPRESIAKTPSRHLLAFPQRGGAISSCFPSNPSTRISSPVTFVPGRASLPIRPRPTGSVNDGLTIGIVVVARLAAKCSVRSLPKSPPIAPDEPPLRRELSPRDAMNIQQMRQAVTEAIREADAAKLRRRHPFIAKYFPYLLRFFRR